MANGNGNYEHRLDRIESRLNELAESKQQHLQWRMQRTQSRLTTDAALFKLRTSQARTQKNLDALIAVVERTRRLDEGKQQG
jgi:hypothetical protein